MTIQAGPSIPAKGKEVVPIVSGKESVLPSNNSVQAQHIHETSDPVEHMVSAKEADQSGLVNSDQGVSKDPSIGGAQGANQMKESVLPSNNSVPAQHIHETSDLVEHMVSAKEADQSSLVNSDQGISKDPSIGGAQGANQMLNMENIVSLVILNMWTKVEERITMIIDDPSPINVHPVLFMHIRRSQLLHLLDKKKIPEAVEYVASQIVGPFREVIKLGQENLVFASVDYLAKEIAWCETCVKAKARLHHVHGETKVLKDVVCDYFRIYIRDKISFEVPRTHKLWQFAFKTETPSGKGKPSFRCIVCSVKEFTKENIGKIESHLNQCFMMDTQYLQQLFRDSCRSKQIDVPSVQSQPLPLSQSLFLCPQTRRHSRLHAGTSVGGNSQTCTQPLTQLPVLTRETVRERFKGEVSIARRIQGQLAVALQDSALPTYLANALNNIEIYADLLFSSEHTARIVPVTVQRDITSSRLPGARLSVQDSSNHTGDMPEESVTPSLASLLAKPTPAPEQHALEQHALEQHALHDAPTDQLDETAGLHNRTKRLPPERLDGTNTNG